MDVSLFDVALLVTVAGLVLGRNDIRNASRIAGRAIGKSVGTLQGIRIKFDERSKSETVANLHRNVKDGIRNVSSIGSDIATILSPTVNRAAIEASAGIGLKSDAVGATSLSSSSRQPPLWPTANGKSPSMPIASPVSEEPDVIVSGATDRNLHKLANLIAAEKELSEREGRPYTRDDGMGSDIILSAINESIVMESYRRNLASNSGNNNNSNSKDSGA